MEFQQCSGDCSIGAEVYALEANLSDPLRDKSFLLAPIIEPNARDIEDEFAGAIVLGGDGVDEDLEGGIDGFVIGASSA